MKQYIKYAPMALFALFCLKALILGVSLYELGALAVLGAFAAYYEKSHNDKFQKEVLEKLEASTKRFDAVDAHISTLYQNDKSITTELQKIKLPASLKNTGFGSIR
jgi:hypothetical protein